jgi:hypothetical protein
MLGFLQDIVIYLLFQYKTICFPKVMPISETIEHENPELVCPRPAAKSFSGNIDHI